MAYTKTQVIAAILQRLQVLGRIGTVSTKDSDLVELRLDAGVSTLALNDVANINPASVDGGFFLPLVAWMAEVCANDYFKVSDSAVMDASVQALRDMDRASQAAQTSTEGRIYTAILRKVGRLRAIDNPSTKEIASLTGRVANILADLSNRDIILIGAASATPANATEPLVAYIAELLRAELTGGEPPNAELLTRQEAVLRRLHRCSTADPVTVGDKFGAA